MSRPCGHSMGTLVYDGAVRCMSCGAVEVDAEGKPRLVKSEMTKLRDALEAALTRCEKCGGHIEYYPKCERCADSTDDHECPSMAQCEGCASARRLLADLPNRVR